MNKALLINDFLMYGSLIISTILAFIEFFGFGNATPITLILYLNFLIMLHTRKKLKENINGKGN